MPLSPRALSLDLRPPGARLGEHYRRWQVALKQFRLPPFRRRYRFGVEIFRSTDQELDDDFDGTIDELVQIYSQCSATVRAA